MDKMVTALQRRQTGSLCLYGVPGAGKTMLAEYLAEKLQKPLHIKRASDLLSKWVGEAEKSIAESFAEAAATGAILLIDECDSFLGSRKNVDAGWQITQVNEFLQQIERFPGIFIATTNLMESLDQAVLRRFTFKINFKAISPAQREDLFTHHFGRLTDLQARELAGMEGLTPGDYAVVAKQAYLLDETLNAEDALLRLKQELAAKTANRARIGF